MSLLEIKREWREKWCSQDGSGKLDLNDECPPFPPFTKSRVINENGVLFLSYFLVLLSEAELLEAEDKHKFLELVYSLYVEPGLTNRHPGNNITRESHDNIVGCAVGAFLCGAYGINAALHSYGVKNGYCYNNINPGKYDIRCLIQGSDAAVVAILSANQPPLWNYIWFLGGVLLNAFTSKNSKSNHASSALLRWVAVSGVSKAFERFPDFPYWMTLSFRVVKAIFDIRLKARYGSKGIAGAMRLYLHREGQPLHPCVRFAEELYS